MTAPEVVSQLAARLDRLPLARFHRRVLYAIAFAFFFELADLNTFAYAATGLEKYLGMSVGTIAHITSASFAGMFIGAALAGGSPTSWGGAAPSSGQFSGSRPSPCSMPLRGTQRRSLPRGFSPGSASPP